MNAAGEGLSIMGLDNPSPVSFRRRLRHGLRPFTPLLAFVVLSPWLWQSAERAMTVREQSSWVQVPCRIKTAETKFQIIRQTDGPDRHFYVLQLAYTYEFREQVYDGTVFDSFSYRLRSDDPVAVRQVADDLPPGLRTACWLDPQRPRSAVLRRRDWQDSWQTIMLPWLLAVVGTVLMLVLPHPRFRPPLRGLWIVIRTVAGAGMLVLIMCPLIVFLLDNPQRLLDSLEGDAED